MFKSLAPRLRRKVNRHASTEVVSIQRVFPNMWIANVEYVHGKTRWVERVAFTRRRVTRSECHIFVTDADYPSDRSSTHVMPAHENIVAFIVAFLASGRW